MENVNSLTDGKQEVSSLLDCPAGLLMGYSMHTSRQDGWISAETASETLSFFHQVF